MAEEYTCPICYSLEEDLAKISCQTCKKEICIDCYCKMTNEKCPFCRAFYYDPIESGDIANMWLIIVTAVFGGEFNSPPAD